MRALRPDDFHYGTVIVGTYDAGKTMGDLRVMLVDYAGLTKLTHSDEKAPSWWVHVLTGNYGVEPDQQTGMHRATFSAGMGWRVVEDTD